MKDVFFTSHQLIRWGRWVYLTPTTSLGVEQWSTSQGGSRQAWPVSRQQMEPCRCSFFQVNLTRIFMKVLVVLGLSESLKMFKLKPCISWPIQSGWGWVSASNGFGDFSARLPGFVPPDLPSILEAVSWHQMWSWIVINKNCMIWCFFYKFNNSFPILMVQHLITWKSLSDFSANFTCWPFSRFAPYFCESQTRFGTFLFSMYQRYHPRTWSKICLW